MKMIDRTPYWLVLIVGIGGAERRLAISERRATRQHHLPEVTAGRRWDFWPLILAQRARDDAHGRGAHSCVCVYGDANNLQVLLTSRVAL